MTLNNILYMNFEPLPNQTKLNTENVVKLACVLNTTTLRPTLILFTTPVITTNLKVKTQMKKMY